MPSPSPAVLRRFGALAAVAALAFPAIAAASVQSGTVTDPAGESPASADIRGVSVGHDTGGATTVTVTLGAAPPAGGTNAIGFVLRARDRFDDCVDPRMVATAPLASGSAPLTAELTRADGSTAPIAGTRSNAGAVVTMSISGNLGDQAGCLFVATLDGDGDAIDSAEIDPLDGWVRPEPPPPPPPPPPAPEPPPVAETFTNKVGRFGPAFRAIRNVPKLNRPGRSYIYGMCRYSVCRIDPVSRRSVRVLKSAKKDQAFEDPTVSQAGGVMAFYRTVDKKGIVYRAARDGRIQRVWEEGEHSPVVRADGRSITTAYTYTRPICTTYPYYNCIYVNGPAISLRSTGEAKSKGIAQDVADIAWWRDEILYAKGTEDSRNQDQYICALDPDGECSRAIAKVDGRVLSQPATSPDGRYLAVIAEPSPPHDDTYAKYKGQILLFAPATGRLIRAVTKGTADTNPTFSPDGKQIAFNRNENLLVVPITGGKPRLIKQKVTISTNSWGLAR